jgi:hypothetical protein
MRITTRIIVILLLPMIAACSSTGVTTNFDAKPGVNFAAFKTYSWVGENPVFMSADMAGRASPLATQRILQAVIVEMNNKGLTFVDDPAQADLVLGLTLGARDKVDVRTYPTSYYGGGYYSRPGYYGSSYWGGTQTTVRNYVEGSLSIDIFDRAANEPVWHGRGTRKLYSSTKPLTDEQLIETIADLLENFPPS